MIIYAILLLNVALFLTINKRKEASMLQGNSNASAISEKQVDFIPIAIVRDSRRLWGRSAGLDRVIGKEVILDPETRLHFNVAGQPRTSFKVTTISENNSYQVATNLLFTMCKRTSEEFGILFAGR